MLEYLGINPDLSEEDLKKELDDAYQDWVGNFQDGGWEILEDEPE